MFDPSDLDLCQSAPSETILGSTYIYLSSFIKIGSRAWEILKFNV